MRFIFPEGESLDIGREASAAPFSKTFGSMNTFPSGMLCLKKYPISFGIKLNLLGNPALPGNMSWRHQIGHKQTNKQKLLFLTLYSYSQV